MQLVGKARANIQEVIIDPEYTDTFRRGAENVFKTGSYWNLGSEDDKSEAEERERELGENFTDFVWWTIGDFCARFAFISANDVEQILNQIGCEYTENGWSLGSNSVREIYINIFSLYRELFNEDGTMREE